MPINRKRRIFRPDGPHFSAPSRGVTTIVLATALVVAGGAWFGVQPSQAPASGAPPGHLSAGSAETRVIDGNTLLLRGRTVQLTGVRAAQRGVAFEMSAGERVDCGSAAANALSGLIGGNGIDCALNGAGEAGRPLATCSAGGRDINAAIVASGWARAETGSTELQDAEQRARKERRGAWAGSWAEQD